MYSIVTVILLLSFSALAYVGYRLLRYPEIGRGLLDKAEAPSQRNLLLNNVGVLFFDSIREEEGPIHQQLESSGASVTSVESPEDALREAFKMESDIILYDLSAATRSGHEVLQELKSKSDLPIVVIMGPEDHDPKQAQDAGARFIIERPIKGERLVEMIASLPEVAAKVGVVQQRLTQGLKRMPDGAA